MIIVLLCSSHAEWTDAFVQFAHLDFEAWQRLRSLKDTVFEYNPEECLFHNKGDIMDRQSDILSDRQQVVQCLQFIMAGHMVK